MAAYQVFQLTLPVTGRTLPSPMPTSTTDVWKLCSRDLSQSARAMFVSGGASQNEQIGKAGGPKVVIGE